MSSTQNRRPLALLPTLSLALMSLPLLNGCSVQMGSGSAEAASDESKDGEEDKKETAVPVEVHALDTGTIEAVLRLSTNLIAEQQVRVHAQAARLVRELGAEEGDAVAKDQVLLRLQDEEQRSALAGFRMDDPDGFIL